MKILIPQGLARNVLAAVRSLGRAGHQVTLAYPVGKKKLIPRRWMSTRYVDQIKFIRSPQQSPDGFVSDVLDLVKREHYDVLLPFAHDVVLPISYHKAEFTPYVPVPFPDYAVLRSAHDKLETVRLAHRLGIKTPVTFCPSTREELLALKDRLPFPALVKARQGCGIGTTIRYARNFDELLRGWEEITAQTSNPPVTEFDRPLIQEYVPGPIVDALYLYNNGSCRAAVTQDRTLTYPENGGVGAVNTTTHNPILRDSGRALLDALGWHGPSQVEFKVDPRDGQLKLLEINPKFWGTLACSLTAGVNFAKMACEMAANGDVPPCFDYRPGVVYHWLFPEETLVYLAHPTRERLASIFKWGARDHYFDWDWRDPMPDLVRAVDTFRMVLLQRSRLLPYRDELNDLALLQPPAVQDPGALAG